MARSQTPLPAVDIIIQRQDRLERPLVLIKRRTPPWGWALSGGFADVGGSLERAAIRATAREMDLCRLPYTSRRRRTSTTAT